MKPNEWSPKRVEVIDLFGHFSHNVNLSSSPQVTIIAGPNGCGKTHLLRILKDFLSADFADLLTIAFGRATVEFSDGTEMIATKHEDSGAAVLDVHLGSPSGEPESFTVTSDEFIADESEDLPGWIIRMSTSWLDTRTQRELSTHELERRYGITIGSEKQRRELLEKYPTLRRISEAFPSKLIDTKRLDSVGRVLARDDHASSYYYGGSLHHVRGRADRIRIYAMQVMQQVSDAQSESLARSQKADEEFVSKLLTKKSNTQISIDTLVNTYDRLSKLSEELSDNGLAGKAVDLTISLNADETEKRILDLFLQDWERKLEPLLPVHRKLATLRSVVNEKFVGKSLSVGPRGALRFVSKDGGEVRVDQLSSGEQHLLTLFTLLLFSAAEGSVVLIDEPEISLHAAWKHAFVADIEKVAALNQLTVVLATHSTAVINGRWELVQEIGVESS